MKKIYRIVKFKNKIHIYVKKMAIFKISFKIKIYTKKKIIFLENINQKVYAIDVKKMIILQTNVKKIKNFALNVNNQII